MEQVNQYPANEKWVAISKDSMNLTSKKFSELKRRSNNENLVRIARKKGVGILVISRRHEEVLVEPKFKKGEYLDCYCLAGKIRQELFNSNQNVL